MHNEMVLNLHVLLALPFELAVFVNFRLLPNNNPCLLVQHVLSVTNVLSGVLM